MKYKNKKKIIRFLKEDKHMTALGWLIAFSVILFVLLNSQTLTAKSIIQFSFRLAAVSLLLGFILKSLEVVLLNEWEDQIKLMNDYDQIMRRYKKDYYTFNGITFPVTDYYVLHKTKIKIQDNKNKTYQLPKIVEDHFEELFQAHKASMVYNQTTIRVDDWTKTLTIPLR